MSDISKIKARSEMLIRKPVSEVFEAFINPEITSKFWFSKGSGRLEPGKQVKWDWEMYNFSINVNVKEVEQDKRILAEWLPDNKPGYIEWRFMKVDNDKTFVSIANWGFTGEDASIVQQAIDSTEGFTFVLAGLKAWLEHGIQLNLVQDRFPAGLER